MSIVMLSYQKFSPNYKTHTFSRAQYLAVGKLVVAQGKTEENQKWEV